LNTGTSAGVAGGGSQYDTGMSICGTQAGLAAVTELSADRSTFHYPGTCLKLKGASLRSCKLSWLECDRDLTRLLCVDVPSKTFV